MANKITMKRLLGFKDFFPNEDPNSKEDYASKVGKEWLKTLCCHFLGLFRSNAVPEIDELFKNWFTFSEFEYSKSPSYFLIADEYKRIQNHHPDEGHEIISAESLLNMFLWASSNTNIPEQVEHLDASSAMPALKLYLLFNDEVLVNYNKTVETIKTIKDNREFQRLTLAMTFPQNDLINIDYAQLTYTQFYKAALLLDFLEKTDRYKKIFEALLNEFHCKDKEEYLKSVGAAIILPFRGNKPGWVEISTANSESKGHANHVMQQLSIQSNEISDLQNDFLALRNTPFYLVQEDSYRVIFDLFLIKKMYNGLIFKLSSYDKNFLGNIRNDFSEEVLVYDILNKVLSSSSSTQITGVEFKEVGLKREPDYYSEDFSDILLFESKDFFMRGEIKLSYDFSLIEGEFKREGRFKKATEQLCKNIERCILKELPLARDYNIETLRIFPILIVHDSLYSAPGLNYVLNDWVNDELILLKQDERFQSFDFSRIMPLTVIEIDTLILYQPQFESKEFDLIRLIEEYHSHVNYSFTDSLPPEQAEEQAMKSVIPFSEFVRDYSFKKNIQLDMRIMHELLDKFGIK